MQILRKFLLFTLFAGAAVQVYAATQDIDAGALSDDKVEVLDVSKPGATGKSFLAATIINAPIPKLCAIILNFSVYPAFMPNTDKTTVVESSDNAALIDMTLALPLGKVKKYRLKMESVTNPQSCHLSWKLVPRPDLKTAETIADTTGYWKMTPHPADPAKTVVKYFVYSDPGPVPLGLGWIVDAMGKDSLPKTLEALRTKAAR